MGKDHATPSARGATRQEGDDQMSSFGTVAHEHGMALPHASGQQSFNLGTHTLEVLEDRGVLLMENATGHEAVHLDEEAAYWLLVALTSLYQPQRK